jgi:hypothetical protein
MTLEDRQYRNSITPGEQADRQSPCDDVKLLRKLNHSRSWNSNRAAPRDTKLRRQNTNLKVASPAAE